MDNSMAASNMNTSRRYSPWLVLTSGFAVMALDGALFITMGTLLPDFIDAFKSTRAKAGSIQSTGLAMINGSGVISGILIQKYGARKVGIVGACLVAIGIGSTYFATSITYVIVSIGVFMAFGASLLIIGCSSAVGTVFVGKRGVFALSAMTMGAGIGGIVYPIFIDVLRSTYGLRGTLLILTAIVANTFVAVLLWPGTESKVTNNLNPNNNADNLSIETTPSTSVSVISTSLNDDGIQSLTMNISDNIAKPPGIIKRAPTTLESIKYLMTNSEFVAWIMGAALVDVALLTFFVFIVDLFIDKNLSVSDATIGLTIANALSLIGLFLPGLLMQSRFISTLTVPFICSSVSVCAFIIVLFIQSFSMMIFVCCLMGVSFGLIWTSVSATTLKLIGTVHFPTAIGIVYTACGSLSVLIGPVSGSLRDLTGSYDIMLTACGASSLFSCVLIGISQCIRKSKQKARQRKQSIYVL